MSGDASASRPSGPAGRGEGGQRSSRPHNRASVGVLAVAAAWLLFLVGLTVFTSNPVTVNLQQVRAANSAAQLRVEDLAGKRCAVVKTFFGGPLPQNVHVVNLDQTAARPAGEYIVALSARADGEYEVTSLRPSRQFPAGIAPLIYPATPEAVAQISAAMAQR